MLNGIKNIFFSLLIIGALCGVAYFAITNLDSGSNYVAREKIRNLEAENKDLSEQLVVLQKKLDTYEPEKEKVEEVKETQPVVESTAKTAYKYASLINELEVLVRENVRMKLKSRGTRVGTIQNFLNIYNNTKSRADNDYGNTTKNAILNFQKETGIPATGETDPVTYQSMIEWLKKQG